MTQRLTTRLGISVSVLILLIVVIAPFYWIFAGSVKTTPDILASVPSFFPQSLTFEHYDKLLVSSDFPRYLLNSGIVAILTMLITVALSVMASYALYRLDFPGRRWLVRVILATYIFPGTLLLIPLYGMMSQLRLVDTLWALVIINVTFAAPFAVWMLQAFFQAIPYEVEEAASLDGASRVTIIWRIFLPLTAPGIGSIAIYAFISAWTEYMFASVLILSDANRTLPVGLAGIIGQYQVDWGLLLAGATLTTLPVLILFSIVGRSFIEGLTAGATK
ncbi:MAG: carbohydrate ABC transporter permease [Anaerolineae bacterium]